MGFFHFFSCVALLLARRKPLDCELTCMCSRREPLILALIRARGETLPLREVKYELDIHQRRVQGELRMCGS